MELRAKSVRSPASAADGERVLVSRMRPRGAPVKVDGWERELAPSTKLDFALWHRWITPREHAALFVAELWSHAPQLRALGQRATTHPVTLLCACGDRVRCRCEVVVEMLHCLCDHRRADCAAAH